MIGLWNVNWLNQNSQRSYPIADFCDRCTAESPDLKIPDDFLLAVRLSINTSHAVSLEKFFVKSILVSGAGCTVVFGYDDGSEYPNVASAHLGPSDGVVNCRLSGLGDYEDSVGYAAFGGWCSLLKEWTGYYTFNPQSSYLEPDCVVPMLRSVSSIRISGENTKHYGDIEFVAGVNMRITSSKVGNVTRIVFDALSTDGFETECECDLHEEDLCVKSINGVFPDVSGNINFVGRGCVTVSNGSSELTFTDTCATPDCKCGELEDFNKTITDMEDALATINTFLESLYSSILQTGVSLTASNANDGGCSGGGETVESIKDKIYPK